MNDVDRIRNALQYIPAHDRETWVECGMAIHAELGQAGRDLWDEWSRGAENYASQAAQSVWRSFKGGKITIASLFARAIAAGYRHDAEYREPTAEELAQRQRERDRLVGIEAAQRAKAYAEASSRAAGLIFSASRAEHPYLAEKGLGAVLGLVTPDAELIVPMRDHKDNALRGAQAIRLVDNEWEKKMSYGMRAKGAVFRIGSPRAAETYFVEGYATGLSVDIALRLLRLNTSVLVCFSAYNLMHVAQNSTGRRFIVADNDASGTGEKAAQTANLPYCMSDVVGEDANDLHVRAGVMALAKMLMEVRATS